MSIADDGLYEYKEFIGEPGEEIDNFILDSCAAWLNVCY